LKVALVCDWYHPRVGGIELHLQDLAARLTAAGHDVVVITPTPGAAEIFGVRVRRVAAARVPRFGFIYTAAGVRAVGDALAEEQADVAHCHVSIVSPAALGGASQAVRRRIPTVVTFHSIVPQTHLLARAARTTLRTAAWPARFSAVSERVACEVRTISGAQPMSILPNGIDVASWRVTPAVRHDDERVRLITVMRLNPKKRPLKLVDMMRALDARLQPGVAVHLRVVGDGPERARLERAIARHGMRDRIELVGHRSRSEIRDLLAQSDLFVLPTVRESIGLATLEARCAGIPVVAMRASGVAELIELGREGLLADSDVDLVRQVEQLIRDRELRCAMSEYNRRTSPPFDWPVVLDAHLAIYREAIALRDSAWADTKR
jgi:glycosyltransferase involved in cell wall biosynthesis